MSLFLPPGLLRQLDSEAKRRGISRSELFIAHLTTITEATAVRAGDIATEDERTTVLDRDIDFSELADYLGIAKATVYKWIEYRQIPYTKTGTLLRFPR